MDCDRRGRINRLEAGTDSEKVEAIRGGRTLGPGEGLLLATSADERRPGTTSAGAANAVVDDGIRRLRRRTAELNLDPNVWFGNVEIVAAKEVGRENVQYVSNVYKYFVAYRMLADLRKEGLIRLEGD